MCQSVARPPSAQVDRDSNFGASGLQAALLPRLFGSSIPPAGRPGHATRAPSVGFELATNGIQFYVIANLEKTSLRQRGPCDMMYPPVGNSATVLHYLDPSRFRGFLVSCK